MAGRAGAAVYASPRWTRTRRAVLDAAGWRCAVCGRFADEVHHRTAIADGGAPFALANLEARCVDCHLDAHHPRARTAREWRRLVVAATKV